MKNTRANTIGVLVCLLTLFIGSSILHAGYWSDPVLLDQLNFGVIKAYGAHVSVDGKTIWFGLKTGDRELYVAHADTAYGDFQNLSHIDLQDSYIDLYYPWVSPDESRLYYGKYVKGDNNVWISYAEKNSSTGLWDYKGDFLGLHDTPSAELSQSLTSNELTMFYHAKAGDDYTNINIWMSSRDSVDDEFATGSLVSELSQSYQSVDPYILPDGLTIYWAQKNTANDTLDLFKATRTSLDEAFSNFEAINLNTDMFNERHPFVTADESVMYFSDERGIWKTTYIPEPATGLLLCLGLAAIRRKKKQ